MWPWEHAALGYLVFSLVIHALYRRSPTGASALVLLVGTQLPDLVDKPLSWGLELFPVGFAVAHSVFVAVPFALACTLLARRHGRAKLGVALLVGYWSHLLGDVLSPLRSGGEPAMGRILWPLVEYESYGDDLGLARGLVYIREYVAEVAATGLTTALALSLALTALAVSLWAVDGFPGVAWLFRRVHRGGAGE
jgi:hypothetical protein